MKKKRPQKANQTEYKKTAGSRLREAMEKKKMSNMELAEKLDISDQMVSDYKNKEGALLRAPFERIIQICSILEIDTYFLLGNITHSTKELETVCAYTGLSEETAKRLHKSKRSLFNIPALLSDLLDNYPEFLAFLIDLEKFLTMSLLQKQSAADTINRINDIDFRDVMKDREMFEQSTISLFQCQRRIERLSENVESDNYIVKRAKEDKIGYAKIITDGK